MFSKKYTALLLTIVSILIWAPTGSYAAQPVVDTSLLDKGIVAISYIPENEAGAIVRIAKGNEKYDYSLVRDARYPLQLGDGDYTVVIAERTSAGKHRVAVQESISVNLENPFTVYLQSMQLVNWNSTTKSVIEAKKLMTADMSDVDKIAAIYRFVTNKYVYDYDKAKIVTTGYIPDLDKIFDESKGICYDYAATFAAMARSVGVPTRMMMGYSENAPATYHAWNQVYLNGEWATIDTTYDAIRIQDGWETPMIKDASVYQITKSY